MGEDPRQRFQDAKFIMLTSYRRDGTGVPTQMWCVYHEGRLYVRTDSTSYKVKRIANNSKVDVAPCDFRGGTKVEPFPAQAQRQPEGEANRIARLFSGKYPLGYYWEVWILKPVHAGLGKVGVGKKRGDTIFYEIVPE